MVSRRLAATVLTVLGVLALLPSAAAAQSPDAAPAVPSEQSLKAGELDALVAPIALYPDSLVSLVLMASTYPLEVVQADRWAKENKKIKGDQLKAEVEKQTWDDSVKSLVATPDVLSMMGAKLDWTLKLGNAVLAQQPDVMDAIQRLRTKADANKTLMSTKEQTVSRRQEQGKEVIVIEPANPDTIYVPYYDPAVVYGEWPYAEYPAYSFAWPGYIASGLIATGIAFGAGYALGRWASGGNYWGGGCNWGDRNININRPRVNPLSGNNWQHNPAHRKGVRYNNPHVSARFGDNSLRGGSQNRMDFRGRSGNQVLRPDGGDRLGAGQRPGGGDRPGAGQRPGGGDRPGAGQRPGGGDRPGAGQRPGGGDRPGTGQRPGGQRPSAGQRPSGPRGGGNALGNIGSGRVAHMQSGRGHASLGGRGGGSFRGGGGGGFHGGGGGGFRGGGGGGFRGGGGRGGGGRRSDITLKHNVILLGHLSNGLGFYRFSYVGNDRAYVGVIAQEVQATLPKAVVRDKEGYLRVLYQRIGIRFQTYEQWIASGAQIPTISH